MADPKTILEYATNRNTNAEQALTAAQQSLAAAQSALNVVNADAENASSRVASLERQATEIRQKLSTIVMPADGEALLDTLEQTIIRIRAGQAATVKIAERRSLAQAALAQAQADVAAATKEQSTAAAALQEATDSNATRQAWSTALSGPPLATINTEAGKALDDANPVEGAAFKKAKDRLGADIPAKLFERAEARRAQAVALVAHENKNTKDVEDAVLKEREDNGGLADAAAKSWVAFKRAEAAAGDFVSSAKASFDQAKSALAEVGNPDTSPLTAEQRARVKDAALEPDREAAADAESTLHTTVLKDVSDKQALLDEAILKAKADPSAANEQAVTDARQALTIAQNAFNTANQTWREKETLLTQALDAVDAKQVALAQAIQQAVAAGNDPNTDPAVTAAKGNLTNAQNNLKNAETAYKASEHGTLDLWEAAVPDTTWRLFEKYEHAVEILNGLKLSNPVTLKNNLKATEEAYATAQLAADKSGAVLEQLTAEQVQRLARQEGAQKTADARLFSALRGDE